MNPAMRTSSPASTRSRVEMLVSCELGMGVAVAVGVGFGVPVGDAVGVGVEVEVGVGEGLEVGAGVVVGVAVGVAVGVGLGVGDCCGTVATKTFPSSRLIQPTLADQTKPRSWPVESMT